MTRGTETKICPVCGTSFTVGGRDNPRKTAIYCSRQCMGKATYGHLPVEKGSHAPRPRKNKDTLHNETWLRARYLDQEMTADEIASILDCSQPTVLWALRKFDIPIRSAAESRRGKPNTTAWTPKMREALAAKRRGELNPMFGTVSPWAGHHTEGVVKTRHRGRTEARLLHPSRPCDVCGNAKSERHHVSGNPADNRAENIKFFCRHHHLEFGHGGHWGDLVVPEGHIDDRAAAPAKTIRPTLTEGQKIRLRERRVEVGKRDMTPEKATAMARRSLEVLPMTSERATEMARRPRKPWSPERRAKMEATYAARLSSKE